MSGFSTVPVNGKYVMSDDSVLRIAEDSSRGFLQCNYWNSRSVSMKMESESEKLPSILASS